MFCYSFASFLKIRNTVSYCTCMDLKVCVCFLNLLCVAEKVGWMKQKRRKLKGDEIITLMVGHFVVVLADVNDDNKQRFWLAQVVEIHPRQADSSRRLTAEWFNAASEFGTYKRWRQAAHVETELEMNQCLFWFDALAKGKIPKSYHFSINTALEHGVGNSDSDSEKPDADDDGGDDVADAGVDEAFDDLLFDAGVDDEND